MAAGVRAAAQRLVTENGEMYAAAFFSRLYERCDTAAKAAVKAEIERVGASNWCASVGLERTETLFQLTRFIEVFVAAIEISHSGVVVACVAACLA